MNGAWDDVENHQWNFSDNKGVPEATIVPLVCRLLENLRVFSRWAAIASGSLRYLHLKYIVVHSWKRVTDWNEKCLRERNYTPHIKETAWYVDWAAYTCLRADMPGTNSVFPLKCVQAHASTWNLHAHSFFATVWKVARAFSLDRCGSTSGGIYRGPRHRDKEANIFYSDAWLRLYSTRTI